MKFLSISLFFIVLVHASYAQERYLLIINGGGFTGAAIAYKINLDGKVLKGSGLAEISYTEESKLKKCAVKRYFKRARALMKSFPDFNHPGNLYSSIVLHEKETDRKITWGDTNHAVPEDAKKLYQKINTALTKVKFTPNEGK